MKQKIAIIGAGISGLVLARQLSRQAEIVVYEKARGVGGRMSTRYADPFYFDHGAQYFTARTKAFQDFLAPYCDAGIVAPWSGKVITLNPAKEPEKRLWFEPHYVATPNMNSLCKHLAEGLEINVGQEIIPVLNERASGRWELQDKAGNPLGRYDWIISTAPPAQTRNLFQHVLPAPSMPHMGEMLGCYAVMLGFDRPWDKHWIAAKVEDNPIQWISINSSKPGRNSAVTSIVIHASHAWTAAHMDDEIEPVQSALISQFEALTEIAASDASYCSTHRWRYALRDGQGPAVNYINPEQKIAATGDWVFASRIEDAWTHAMQLADQMKQML